MKRLELFKAFTALTVLASAFNTHFDLLRISRQWELHLALSLICSSLFLIGLYHDRLGRRLQRTAKEEEHLRFGMTRKAAKELMFTEGLLTFLFAIPVIPTMLSFPGEPHLGLSVLLFPLHGLIRCFRTRYLKNLELILGENGMVITLRSPLFIQYKELRRAEFKYEDLYLILRDNRVRSLPLAFLQEEGKEALKILGQRLKEKGIEGADELQASSPSTKSRE